MNIYIYYLWKMANLNFHSIREIFDISDPPNSQADDGGNTRFDIKSRAVCGSPLGGQGPARCFTV